MRRFRLFWLISLPVLLAVACNLFTQAGVAGRPAPAPTDTLPPAATAAATLGEVQLYPVAAVGNAHDSLAINGFPRALAFFPDGTRLLSQGDGEIVAWDWAKGSNLKTVPAYGTLSFDPSGQHLVTCWYDPNSAATIARIFDLMRLGQSKDIRPKFVQRQGGSQPRRGAGRGR